MFSAVAYYSVSMVMIAQKTQALCDQAPEGRCRAPRGSGCDTGDADPAEHRADEEVHRLAKEIHTLLSVNV